MCRVLQVSRSGYYAWQTRRAREEAGQRQEQRMKWIQQIKEAHQSSRCTYGSPRVTVELKERGVAICQNTVAKLMKREGLRARIQRRFVPRTTDANHPHPIAPNRLERQFTAPAPNRKWTGDITYIATEEGWLYLAVVMDLCSRRIVGWAMR